MPSHRLLDSSQTSISPLLSKPPNPENLTKPSLPTTRRRPRRRLYQPRQDEVSQNPPGALDPASTLLSRFGGLAPRVGGNKIIRSGRLRLRGRILGAGVHMVTLCRVHGSARALGVSRRDVAGLDGTVGFPVV